MLLYVLLQVFWLHLGLVLGTSKVLQYVFIRRILRFVRSASRSECLGRAVQVSKGGDRSGVKGVWITQLSCVTVEGSPLCRHCVLKVPITAHIRIVCPSNKYVLKMLIILVILFIG